MPPFIATLITLIFAIIFFSLYPLLNRVILKKNYKKIYSSKIRNISIRNKFIFLDKIELQTLNNDALVVDQLLCGKKYVYVINDYCHFGILSGKVNDNSWIKVDKIKKTAEYVNNLFETSKNTLNSFSRVSKIDRSMLVGISLINNECDIRLEKKENELNFVVTPLLLTRLIRRFEGSDIASLDQEQLKIVVEEIKDLNEKTSKN